MVSCSLISREEDADSASSLLHSPLYSPPAAVRSDALDADPPLLVTPLTTFGGINASCDDAHPCKNLLSCVQGTCANVLVNATCDPSVPNVCGSYGLECINISVSSGIHSTFSSSSSSFSSSSSSSFSSSSSSSPSIQPGFHCILPHQLAGMVCYPAYGDQQCASGYCDAKGVCESISKLHGPCALSQGQCTPGLYCAPSPSVGDPLLGQCAPSIAVGQSCASALPLPAPNHVCVSGSSCVADGNAGATCVRYYASTVGQPCALDSPYTSCRYGLRCLSNASTSSSSTSSLNNDNNQNINVPRVGYCAKFPSSNPTSCVGDDECMMGFRCVDGALLSGGGGAANGTRRCAAVLNAGCQPELDILTQCLAQFDCPFEPEAMLGTTQLLGPALPGSCTAQNCQLQHTKAVCCQTKPRFQALPYSPAFYLRGMCYPAPTFPWYGTVFISLGFSLLVAAAVVLTLVCLKRRRLSREASSSPSSDFPSSSSAASSAQQPLLAVSPDSGDDDDEERGYARLGRASHSSYSDAAALALPSQPSARLLSIGTLGGEAIALSRQAEDASSVSTSFLRSDRFLLSPDHSEPEDDDDDDEYKEYSNEYNNEYNNAQPRLSHPDMRTPHHAAQPRLSHPLLARTHLSPSPISPSATPSSSLGQDAVVSPTLSTSPPSFSPPSFSSPSSALPAYPAYSYSHHSSQTASLPASLTIAMSPVGIAPLPALSGDPPAHDLTPIDHPSFSDDEDDNDDSNEDQRLL